jgi:hypothetical protein
MPLSCLGVTALAIRPRQCASTHAVACTSWAPSARIQARAFHRLTLTLTPGFGVLSAEPAMQSAAQDTYLATRGVSYGRCDDRSGHMMGAMGPHRVVGGRVGRSVRG